MKSELLFVGLARVAGQSMYTVYIRFFWLEIHQIYSHIRCMLYGSGQPQLFVVFGSFWRMPMEQG
jgi:hypothetical protein